MNGINDELRAIMDISARAISLAVRPLHHEPLASIAFHHVKPICLNNFQARGITAFSSALPRNPTSCLRRVDSDTAIFATAN
jgi:hypothetical protein